MTLSDLEWQHKVSRDFSATADLLVLYADDILLIAPSVTALQTTVCLWTCHPTYRCLVLNLSPLLLCVCEILGEIKSNSSLGNDSIIVTRRSRQHHSNYTRLSNLWPNKTRDASYRQLPQQQQQQFSDTVGRTVQSHCCADIHCVPKNMWPHFRW